MSDDIHSLSLRIQSLELEFRKFTHDQDQINRKQKDDVAEIRKAVSKMRDQAETDSLILKKLASLWLKDVPDPEGNQPHSKSRAIGTWSGWKMATYIFTIISGVVLAYQILVPVLVALNNALLNATIFVH